MHMYHHMPVVHALHMYGHWTSCMHGARLDREDPEPHAILGCVTGAARFDEMHEEMRPGLLASHSRLPGPYTACTASSAAPTWLSESSRLSYTSTHFWFRSKTYVTRPAIKPKAALGTL